SDASPPRGIVISTHPRLRNDAALGIATRSNEAVARTISNAYTITQSITTTNDNPVYVTGAVNVAGSGVGIDALVNATITVTGAVSAGGVGIRLHTGGTVTDAGFISGGAAAVAFYPGFNN